MSRFEELLTAFLNGEVVDFEPLSRMEQYLKNCCDKCGCDGLPTPNTRAEILLYQLAEQLKNGGGGGTEADVIDGFLQGTLSGEYYNDRITKIVGSYKFGSQKQLTSVSLPNVTTSDMGAFYFCTELKDVYLPLLKSLGTQSFYACSSLSRLELPSVTSISGQALAECSNLTTLILTSPTMCKLTSSGAFTNTPIANGTGFIYFLDNLVEDYKVATNWVTYANQIKGISELVEG